MAAFCAAAHAFGSPPAAATAAAAASPAALAAWLCSAAWVLVSFCSTCFKASCGVVLAPTPYHEGSGLGLAIVGRIIHRHQGKITIDSTLGEGTTVSIWLPRYGVLSESDLPAESATVTGPIDRS